jgi:hypothetical protein
METYKGIAILNIDATDRHHVKQVIDTLQAERYELYEVITRIMIGPYDRKIYYTTCLHSDNNQTLILN